LLTRLCCHALDRAGIVVPMLQPPAKTNTWVTRTPLAALGGYHCRLGHRQLGPEDATLGHIVNLHRVGTYLKHVEGRKVFVEPGSVVFFPRGQAYRTSHPHGCGDSGRWMSLRQEWLAELCAQSDPRVAERPERPLVVHALPPDPRMTLAIELLFARAAEAEALALEEQLGNIVVELARRAGAAPRITVRVDARQRALGEALRARLARRLDERASLGVLARELGASPFALCRAFKAQTGMTMSSWRRQVRLQAALVRVLDSDQHLLAIALDLGFASHSHLTREFRATFGTTPSELRHGVRSRAALARETRAAFNARRRR
jgi:AraC family transcriptional regulator